MNPVENSFHVQVLIKRDGKRTLVVWTEEQWRMKRGSIARASRKEIAIIVRVLNRKLRENRKSLVCDTNRRRVDECISRRFPNPLFIKSLKRAERLRLEEGKDDE